ncbi:MAG: Hercynine oxygenase [Myxococcota bacterium]|nr:Hercynine oxygenase [Myxococcota bacterium]
MTTITAALCWTPAMGFASGGTDSASAAVPEMAHVPGGDFLMGDDEGGEDQSPARLVYVSSFYMDIHETTVAGYQNCVAAGVCRKPMRATRKSAPDLPVTGISQADASTYCRWAGKRLPTEAEWEKAARGPDGRKYPWGNEDPDCTRANFDACGGKLKPVGSHPAGVSPYGIHDMAGNAREFAADWYADDYYRNAPGSDPQGPESGRFHVLRGAGYRFGANMQKASMRWRGVLNLQYTDFGMRCASSFPPAVRMEPAMRPAPVQSRDTSKPPDDMVRIPAGEFTMGSNGPGNDDESPAHKVRLDAFEIDRTEVTNEHYHRCAAAGICRPPLKQDDNLNGPEQPVVGVSYSDAQTYCAWVGKRLPTEAEWEKAARGVDERRYPWGDLPPDCRLVNAESCDGVTKPAGSHPAGASPYGVLDLVGNAREFVNDWYGRDYYQSSPAVNPPGPEKGAYNVLRGSSWRFPLHLQTTTIRWQGVTNLQYQDFGFRCAR